MGKHSNYVIQPRGKPLYEDESSFGSRMLAKMGWSKGKGLGARENGSQDFIRVRYKNDIGGLGYSARDDQWTENEFTYNALLKNLNGECNEVGENSEAAEKNIKSLEEKSKKSRSRVHYQKFTRGKDLSRYSAKDLANIFGKKSLDESYSIEKSNENSASNSSVETEIEPDSKIINTGISITEYFKQKQKNMDSDQKIKKQDEECINQNVSENDQEPDGETTSTKQTEEIKEKKFKKSKKRKMDTEPEEINETVEPALKKSKKEKIHKDSGENIDRILDTSNELLNEDNNILKTEKEDQVDNSKTTITITSNPNKFHLDSVGVEKLKSLRLEKFKNSNIANVVGYGLSKDIKLEICDSSIVKGVSHVNKYSIYANVDKMHSKKYYKSLLLRYHKKRNTFKI